jgi:glucan phosphoethanolaminetransferase (alkaline phosphatase superfamily)
MSIVHEVRKHILLSGRWMLLLGIFMVPLIVWGVLNSGQSGVWVRVIRLGTVSLMWFVLPLMWLRTRYCVWLFGLAIISVVAETGHLLVTSAFFNAGTMRSVLATNPGEAAELMGSLLPFLPLIALIPVWYFLCEAPSARRVRSRCRWWLPSSPDDVVGSEGVDYHRL